MSLLASNSPPPVGVLVSAASLNLIPLGVEKSPLSKARKPPATSSLPPGLVVPIPTFPVPLRGEKMIFPVVAPPMVRVWLFVVCMVPEPDLNVSCPPTEAAPATSRVAVGEVVPIPTLPELVITNLVAPLEEAVNKSPAPALSITMAAKEVFADREATGAIPLV